MIFLWMQSPKSAGVGGVLELAVDRSQTRPPPGAASMPPDNPFTGIDLYLYLIADFGPGEYHWGCKKHHMDVEEDIRNLLGCHVWIEDKGILEMNFEDGSEWAQKELDGRYIVYAAE